MKRSSFLSSIAALILAPFGVKAFTKRREQSMPSLFRIQGHSKYLRLAVDSPETDGFEIKYTPPNEVTTLIYGDEQLHSIIGPSTYHLKSGVRYTNDPAIMDSGTPEQQAFYYWAQLMKPPYTNVGIRPKDDSTVYLIEFVYDSDDEYNIQSERVVKEIKI